MEKKGGVSGVQDLFETIRGSLSFSIPSGSEGYKRGEKGRRNPTPLL
jgi:hypothetical protein